MLRKLNIHKKLALVLWGSAFTAFAIAGLGLMIFQKLTLEGRAMQVIEPYAQLVSVGTEGAVAFEDPDRAQEILDTLRANQEIREASIVLKDGRVLAGFGSQPDTIPNFTSEESEGIRLSGDTAELWQTLSNGARLRLVMNLARLKAQTHQVMWLLGASGIVLLAVTLGQMAVLQRAIIRPITTLAEAAEMIRTRGDFDQHVPTDGDDEVAQLGRSFKAMMEALQKREQELRQLALSQRTLVESAAYGIVSATPDGLVTSFNPAAERLLGYTADEVVGIQTPVLWHDPEEMKQRARQLSGELGQPINPGFEVFTARAGNGLADEMEWTFIRKDGARIPVLLSVTALREESGRLTGFVGLVNDLTERKRAEEEIRKLNQELEARVVDRTSKLAAANKELEAFAYSVSHDLRAPLRHIVGFVDLLQNSVGKALEAQSRHYMNNISDAAEKMGLLIDNLLSFSRMGRNAMSIRQVALGQLVRDVIGEFEPDTVGRTIDWRIGDLPVVDGDASMLRIVFGNLISNALKFTQPRKQAQIRIETLPDQASETVIFVSDNGVGFDKTYADKLFGVFQRLHRADEFEGIGIGLANVRRIIARHGGRTWAEGKVGHGATFYFSLP